MRDEAQSPKLVVRSATVADAPAIAAIGSVGFPAVHNDVVGPTFAAVVVEQTYSIAAVTECITRCGKDDEAEFLLAEDDGRFSVICATTATALSPSFTVSTSTSSASARESTAP